jgi:hypothetical protein
VVAVALVHCVQDRVDLRVDIKNIFSQNYFILFNVNILISVKLNVLCEIVQQQYHYQ